MALTGQQIKLIQQALLDGYPSNFFGSTDFLVLIR